MEKPKKDLGQEIIKKLRELDKGIDDLIRGYKDGEKSSDSSFS